MEITVTRHVEPLTFKANVEFSEAELIAAFNSQDPDEDLFYEAFYSPSWPARPGSEKLSIMSRIAMLAEMASQVTVVVQPPEPK